MQSKEIAEVILNEARERAAAITAEAEEKRQRSLAEAKAVLAQKKDEVLAEARKEAEQTVRRREMLARLEAKKLLLGVKQQLIDRVYADAASRIVNMTDNLYRTFIESLLKEYAEDGDEVMIAKQDAKRLNYDWLHGFAAKMDMALTLATDYHDDRGGIILKGKHYDKRLTLSSLIGEIRPSGEGDVAAKLFN